MLDGGNLGGFKTLGALGLGSVALELLVVIVPIVIVLELVVQAIRVQVDVDARAVGHDRHRENGHLVGGRHRVGKRMLMHQRAPHGRGETAGAHAHGGCLVPVAVTEAAADAPRLDGVLDDEDAEHAEHDVAANRLAQKRHVSRVLNHDVLAFVELCQLGRDVHAGGIVAILLDLLLLGVAHQGNHDGDQTADRERRH